MAPPMATPANEESRPRQWSPPIRQPYAMPPQPRIPIRPIHQVNPCLPMLANRNRNPLIHPLRNQIVLGNKARHHARNTATPKARPVQPSSRSFHGKGAVNQLVDGIGNIEWGNAPAIPKPNNVPGIVMVSGIVFSSMSMNVATVISEINTMWLKNCD